MVIAELFLTYYSRFFHLWLTLFPASLLTLLSLLAAFRSFSPFGLIVLESGVSGRIAARFAVIFCHFELSGREATQYAD